MLIVFLVGFSTDHIACLCGGHTIVENNFFCGHLCRKVQFLKLSAIFFLASFCYGAIGHGFANIFHTAFLADLFFPSQVNFSGHSIRQAFQTSRAFN